MAEWTRQVKAERAAALARDASQNRHPAVRRTVDLKVFPALITLYLKVWPSRLPVPVSGLPVAQIRWHRLVLKASRTSEVL